MCIIRIPEGEDWENGTEKVNEELVATDFPNLMKTTYLQIQNCHKIKAW